MAILNDPKTKARLLDRILSIDFDGDLRHLGQDVTVSRIKPNKVKIRFPQSGAEYVLAIQKPRGERPMLAAEPARRRRKAVASKTQKEPGAKKSPTPH